MADEKSLVNFGDLSKPATVLVEKISGAIGLLYEPTRIKREASAKAEAEKIHALANIEISEIEQRALNRLIHEEGKKQENIESITAQAAASVQEDASPENIEDDWISHFFDKCRNVSDKEMQGLWSKLLAGEANKPGSYSKRTIELISALDKSDAHLFTRLCSFVLTGGEFIPAVLDYNAEIYKRHEINFATLTHLDSLGLIKFNSLAGFMLQSLPKKVALSYYGTPISFTLQNESNNNLEIGNVWLTQVGQQLAPVCGSSANPEFLTFMFNHYKNKGIKSELLLPNNPSQGTPKNGTPA